MQITIRGHHLSITPAIEDTIRCKFAEMTKHIDQVLCTRQISQGPCPIRLFLS